MKRQAKTTERPAAKKRAAPPQTRPKSGPGPVIGLEWRRLALADRCVLVARFADGSERTVQTPDGLTPSV